MDCNQALDFLGRYTTDVRVIEAASAIEAEIEGLEFRLAQGRSLLRTAVAALGDVTICLTESAVGGNDE